MTSILIVEDNASSLKTVKDVLRMAGFNTIESENINTAPTLHKEAFPDLILKAAEIENEREIDEFFMIASHDLQAPLRKINQFTNMLQRSTQSHFSPDDLELLQGIERSSRQMNTLISDIVILSRVNQIRGNFDKVDLSVIVQEAIRDNQTTIENLNAQVQVGNMVCLEADPSQLRQLFQILIDNGLKFQRPGIFPVIKINSQIIDENCEITVADNGIGFEAEDQEKIFKPFVRLHGSSEYPGQGMGLTIAHRIVRRHHGQITATSQPGQGSVFKVVLPAQQE